MAKWPHPKSQIREVLNAADAAGFKITVTRGRGHSWGRIDCPSCGQRLSVWSTPKNADNHGKQIRRFIQRHSHTEDTEG